MTPPASVPALNRLDSAASFWWAPGALVLRLMLVAVLAVGLAGGIAAWLVAQASGQETVRRLVEQQNDEVEMLARLLASKIEQSQKVLAAVAAGITPSVIDSPASLEWLMRQGLPAARFFDSLFYIDNVDPGLTGIGNRLSVYVTRYKDTMKGLKRRNRTGYRIGKWVLHAVLIGLLVSWAL